MAIKKITIFWRDIPSQVLVQKGRTRKKQMLEHRFQEAIDRAAMRAGKGSSEKYIAEWRRESELIESGIDVDNLLIDEVTKFHQAYTDEDLEELIRSHGVKTSE
ncbi:MAG: virulence factor [Pseudomonadota bacterium]|nr:virulence factor [Pseudomonadota bacterium]